MKKYFLIILLLFTVMFVGHNAWAGAEINNSNLTGRYFRDLSPYADADAIYNPAGLAFEKRNFVMAGTQVVFKDYCSGNPIECAENVSFVPDLSLHYRYSDTLSYFGAYYIAAGGGKLEYDEGNAITQAIVPAVLGLPQNITVEGAYHALRAGVAYKADDNVRIAGGVMYVMGEKLIEGAMGHPNPAVSPLRLKLEQEAAGMTLFASLHYKYDELSDFSINFVGPVRLEWETDIKTISPVLSAAGLIKTQDVREDLPATFSLAVKRKIPTDTKGIFEIKSGITYYLQKDFGVVWDSTFTAAGGGVDKNQKNFGNAYEISLGGTWEPVADGAWKFYAGYLYSDPQANPDYTSSFKPSLVSSTIGTGLDYKFNQNWVLNLGGSKTFYEDAVRTNGTKLDRDGYALSSGIQYFF